MFCSEKIPYSIRASLGPLGLRPTIAATYALPPPFAVPRPVAERRPLLLPCDVRRSREGLSFPMHVEFGKRDQPSVDAANDDGLGTRRIFVRDRKTRISFLVDTGADTCVYPRSSIREQVNKTDYELFAANGTRIATYGTIMMSLDLSLRRIFEWRFVIADVQTPIIGVDFLSHYGLLVDPRNRRLLDTTTQLASKGYPASTEEMSMKTVYGETVYHRLLAEFPDLIHPPAFGWEKIRHAVVHHIETTSGSPVSCKPRRLAPDRLKQVKAEFATTIEQGVMRPSKSPWASPLHVVPKKDGNLRPCGDYRALNARTVPDKYSPHIWRISRNTSTVSVFFFFFQKSISSALTIKSRSRRKTSRKPRSRHPSDFSKQPT